MYLVVYFNGDNTWTVLNGHKLEVHYPEKGVFIGSILTTKNSAKRRQKRHQKRGQKKAAREAAKKFTPEPVLLLS